ncbi:MAG TPA: DUF1015 domain-containing protein [Actinomycetota bacterium]|nr:DUF1015 domain-containing protein [Actinomycetota bacterium]
MPEVRPFVGLFYDPAVAGPLEKLTAPPYDLISPDDQARLYRASPYNIVRLDLGKDEPGDSASDDKYTRAAAYLSAWRSEGVLSPTREPCVYPYELRFQLEARERRIRGVIAEVSLDSSTGTIVPHERTMPGPVRDRLRLLRNVQANLSPIYTVFAGPAPELSHILDTTMKELPRAEVTDETGTTHTLWATAEHTDAIAHAVKDRILMIADGHHRYTVALAYQDEMQQRRGPGPWDSMMMLIVDAGSEDPPVLPIHRVARNDTGPAGTSGRVVRDLAEVLASVRDEDLTYGTVRWEDGNVVHRVASLNGEPPTVRALHDSVLDVLPDLGLRFIADVVAAERAVLDRSASVAYVLPPTKVDRVWSLVRAGEKMPQKSTYFWPKPRTGLVIRPFLPD